MKSQSGEKIRVLLVDDIAETRENLRKLLSFDPDVEVVGAGVSGEEGVELARQFRPHVILMDINMPGMNGIAATEIIMREMPATQVVMLSVQGESDYMRQAMLAGARDFLTKPPSGDELMSTVHRAYETGKAQAAMMAPAQPLVSTMGQAEGQRGRRQGNVIAIFSPKGGVGCTTIAVNLAIALQRIVSSEQKVALMDTSLQFGDVGVMLNLQASRSIADLASQIDGLDSDMLSSVMTAHGSGIKVLLAPPHPEAAESILSSTSPDEGMGGNPALKAILELMRDQFDVIVVDMWSWVDDVALTIFDAAALIVLVVMPNIPSIKSSRMFLEVMTKLNYSAESIGLVVNGVDRRMSIRVEQIEQAMLPVVAQIPLDEQAARVAANQGTPLFVRDQHSPISQGILQLAGYVRDKVLEDEESEERRGTPEVAPKKGGTGLLRRR